MQKCITTEDKNITVLNNMNVLKYNGQEAFPRRPDIYVQNRRERKAYIIDITIVKDEKISKVYINKVNKYGTLLNMILKDKELKYVRIIPIILTINGFVHKKSLYELKNELKIIIKFDIIFKNVLVKEMKDLMYYTTNENINL